MDFSGTAGFLAGSDTTTVVIEESMLPSLDGPWFATLDVPPDPTTGVEAGLASSAWLADWPDAAPGAFWVDGITDAVEGVSGGSVTIGRLDTTSELTINYAIDPDSTGVAELDYATPTGTIAFAVGQQFATIPIDASGFSDPDLTSTRTVVLDLADPLPGFEFDTQPVVLLQPAQPPAPPNQPPVFTQPRGYSFSLGRGSTSGTIIGQAQANDPDMGDVVRYSITGGNDGGYFSIDNDGRIRLTKDLPLGQDGPFNLTVKGSDGKGGDTSVNVQIGVKQLVLISGDLFGVATSVGPGMDDDIRLDFTRTGTPQELAQALTVTYTVAWGTTNNAAGTDLVNPAALTGTIVIPAGQSRASIPLVVNHGQGGADALKTFTVTIDETATVTGNPNSGSSGGKGDKGDKGKPTKFVGQGTATVTILPAVTLKTETNNFIDPNLANGDSRGLHVNDIRQGKLGDCFFLAVLASLARSPDSLARLWTENGNGTVTFYFYVTPGQAATPITVAMTLDEGLNQAKLSGDYDANGRYEIWVQLFERAYNLFLQGTGQGGINDGGRSSTVFRHLGLGDSTVDRLGDLSLADLRTKLIQAVASQRMVILGTDANGDGKKAVRSLPLPDGQNKEIPFKHGFVVVNIVGDNAIVYNPWGDEYPVAIADLPTYFDHLTITERPFANDAGGQ